MNKNSGTYYGFINGLLSLIPIFPAWSMYPAAFIGAFLGPYIPCQLLFTIVSILACISSIIYAVVYYNRINHYESRDKKDYKADFRFFCFKQYMLIHTFSFILIVGVDNLCQGDGQSVLAIMFSGPVASLIIFILGILFDLTFKKELIKQ